MKKVTNGRAPFAGGQLLHRNLGGGVLSKNRNVAEGLGAKQREPVNSFRAAHISRPLRTNLIMEV